MFFGVNRHDFDPDTGRVVTEEQMRADLVLLKQFGFNAVRTSHSPNDPRLLDLCDELGVLVVDEANIESHAFNFSLVHDPRYRAQWWNAARGWSSATRTTPCVVMWSLGNESGYGAAHDALAAWIRHRDPTRPLHYEGAIMLDWRGGQAATDVLCPMYPEIWTIEAAGRRARPDPAFDGLMPRDRPARDPVRVLARDGQQQRVPRRVLRRLRALRPLQGGFIWEFWDHGLRQQAYRAPGGAGERGGPLPGARAHGERGEVAVCVRRRLRREAARRELLLRRHGVARPAPEAGDVGAPVPRSAGGGRTGGIARRRPAAPAAARHEPAVVPRPVVVAG